MTMGLGGLMLLALATGAASADETPFEPSGRSFADAAACKAWLKTAAGEARGQGYDAVEGPYELAPGDIRIHTVRAEGNGHRIAEQRCLEGQLSGRSWRHAMVAEEQEFTVDSVVRSAPWLQKGGR
jgi:hypothetical protein